MSNIEFLLFIFLSSFLLQVYLVIRSIRKKSPRIMIKYFFAPVLISLVISYLLQASFAISEMSMRQLIGNLLVALWCVKSFYSYKSVKMVLLIDALNTMRKSISDKNYMSLILTVLKISFIQFLCFSSIFSLNYLSGYSKLNFVDLSGLIIAATGIALEIYSENRVKKSQKNRLIDGGLWSFVKHPNLFGIWLFFLGIQVLAFGAVGSVWSLIGLILVSIIIFKYVFFEYENKLASKYQNYVAGENLSGFFPFLKR